jgi:hypothetical protein
MSKSFTFYKTRKTLKNRKIKNRRKKLNTRERCKKAGNGEKVLCSMCEKMFSKDKTLIPRECLMKHGKAAHRICYDCWFDPESGFALESSVHKCPGCQKGLPLTSVKKEDPVLIDLTEE